MIVFPGSCRRSMLFITVLLLIFSSLHPCITLSQEQIMWHRAKGPYSGEIRALLAVDTLILAGTWNSGIFSSSDNGEVWRPLNKGLSSTNIHSLVRVQTDSGRSQLLVGTWESGVFRSTDNGETWNYTGLANTNVHALVVGTNGTLIAGTELNGIFRSRDNGVTWEESNTGLTSKWILSLAVFPNGTFVAGTWEGVFRSTDNGETWTQSGLSHLLILSLTANISNGTLFAGTDEGIFRSQDNGETWITTNLPNAWVYALAAQGDTAFAGTLQDGVFRSTDNGHTWQSLGLEGFWVYTLAVHDNMLFVGTWEHGVFRLTTKASNAVWQHVGITPAWVRAIATQKTSSGDNTSDEIVFAGTERDGVFRSLDNGITWMPVHNGMRQKNILSLIVHNNALFAGTWDGVFRSLDNGTTWTQTSLRSHDIHAFAAVHNGELFAGTSGGIYRTADHGTTWTQTGLSDIPVLSLFALNAETLLAGIAGFSGGGVFRSTDSGKTWKRVEDTVLAGKSVLSFSGSGTGVLAQEPYTIMAGTGGFSGGTVLSSSDNGTTWKETRTGMPTGANIRAFLTVSGNGNSVFFVGITVSSGGNGGVFFLPQASDRWADASAGLHEAGVYCMQRLGNTLLAGTTNGVFKALLNSIVGVSARNEADNHLLAHVSVGSIIDSQVEIMPHPIRFGASNGAIIRFKLRRPAQPEFLIIDAFGHIVYRSARSNEQLSAGIHNIPFPSEAYSLPAGLYILCVRVGGELHAIRYLQAAP